MTVRFEADSEAAAHRVEAWCGEPLLHEGEDLAVALAPVTVRRQALDAALAEMARGLPEPSYEWRRDYALVLGLERVLSDPQPRLASGTTLRRHQVDALAGQLAALISDLERSAALDEDDADDEPENGDDEPETLEVDVDAEIDEDEDEDEDEGDGEDEDEDEAGAAPGPAHDPAMAVAPDPDDAANGDAALPDPEHAAATASNTQRRRARRSRPEGSSRPLARRAS